MLESRHRSYPILDENDKVVGTLSRYHLIKPRRKRVVLVDHNEVAQSVPGLEQADILEIIDHHRLADIQTGGSHLLPQRARRLDRDDHLRDVSGARAHAPG